MALKINNLLASFRKKFIRRRFEWRSLLISLLNLPATYSPSLNFTGLAMDSGLWETIAMPVLTATVFHDQTKSPIAWKCSVCETVFALDRVDAILTKKSTEQINKDFEMHCKTQHPGSK